jgi:hypothetical protein
MLAGELYLATDPQLVAEDLRAQELLFRFNMPARVPTTSGALYWLICSRHSGPARYSTHHSAATMEVTSPSAKTHLSTRTASSWTAIGSSSGAKCRSRPASRSTPRLTRSTRQPAVRNSSLLFP